MTRSTAHPFFRAPVARLALAAALLALAAGGAWAQAAIGDPAPDFTLLGNDGQSHTLSDRFGQQVQLIYFMGYG